MPSFDLKSRFDQLYEQEIHDPVLGTILRAMESYQQEVQNELLLSIYAERSDTISDGLFEVLKRHLFGHMFPGPAFVVAYATLKENAAPQRLLPSHYFSVQDTEGNKVLFAAQSPCWVVPGKKEVRVDSYGDDLRLVFDIVADAIPDAADEYVSVYCEPEVDVLLAERLRCRIAEQAPQVLQRKLPVSPLRPRFPGKLNAIDEFFHTPHDSRFLHIPFSLLRKGSRKPGEGVSIPFIGLGGSAGVLQKKLTLNAFTAWNLEEEFRDAMPAENGQFYFDLPDADAMQAVIANAEDQGADPPIEYLDAAATMDPGYPYQYTTSLDIKRNEVYLAMSPSPTGTVRVRLHHYNLGTSCIGLPPGSSMQHQKGIPEQVKAAYTISPTHRLEAVEDKQRVWSYFRLLIASRNRWLTRDDLRSAVLSFPPFAAKKSVVRQEKIGFEEKVGRVRGFLTPFTEILVPIYEKSILHQPDLSYFERQLGLYIKSRTIHGNFVRTRLVPAEQV